MTQPPEPNEKLPVNEQIAEILLKVITTGGLAGGGAGAFWSLFKESDVPKAIASAVIGVGLAYGAKLLLPVHRGNERRLTKAGEAIDSGIDAGLGLITAGMIAAASRFDDKYLLCQALECQSFRSEGLAQQPGIFVPLLKEVFVLLALDLNASDPGYRSLSRNRQQFERQFEQQQFQNQSIWDFIKRAKQVPVFRQLAILAWGGYGKTTLLKHIAYLYGTKQTRPDVPKLIPVLLVLRTYKDLLAQDAPPSLPVLIEQHYIPRLAEAECLTVPDGWAQNLLTKGRALVMFDGFDEVAAADRPKVARWLNRQMRQYGKSMFVVTSRPKAYREQAPVDALGLTSSVWVKDFDSVQRQRFVERWYQCQERYAHGGRTTPDVAKIAGQAAKELLEQIEAELDLRALAKNPLLLNMITTFHRRYAGRDLPQRRVELYQEIVQLQLKDRPMMRKLKTRLSECEPETVLQEIAIAMMQGHAERVERDELFQFTQNILTNQGEMVLAQDFIEDVVQISELMVQQEDEYEFAHLSFQEYLAAACIAAEPRERESFLYERMKEDWWKATILLYAGKAKKPSRLIREAMRQGNNDLAYACLQQTTKRVDDVLRAELANLSGQLQDARYADLERYLQNGQWKEADNETYRLMITEVGKEKGQLFDSEDLLTFPCEPLRAIDRLWVKHSGGKFGFSVQKDLYLQCGGVPDGNIWKEAWDKFFAMNGWAGSIRYELASPAGHLPCLLGVRGRVFGVFFSRIQTCEL